MKYNLCYVKYIYIVDRQSTPNTTKYKIAILLFCAKYETTNQGISRKSRNLATTNESTLPVYVFNSKFMTIMKTNRFPKIKTHIK